MPRTVAIHEGFPTQDGPGELCEKGRGGRTPSCVGCRCGLPGCPPSTTASDKLSSCKGELLLLLLLPR